MDSRVVLVVLAVIIGAWFWFRHRGGSSRRAEAQLDRICLGNQDQVDRLISAEMTRAPGITRAEAIARAIERYQRDNR